MKPEILTIKKEGQREIPYYYNREKRLSMKGAPDFSHRKKKGFLKGNIPLKFILLDVLIIFILTIGIRLYFKYEIPAGELNGFRAVLSETVIRDRIFITLEAERKDPEALEEEILVLYETQGGGQILEKRYHLPPKGSPLRQYKEIMPFNDTDTTLRARIRIGSEEKTLMRRLKK